MLISLCAGLGKISTAPFSFEGSFMDNHPVEEFTFGRELQNVNLRFIERRQKAHLGEAFPDWLRMSLAHYRT